MNSKENFFNRNDLKVSVIVTNYNYGHYLTACLDSLRTQTRPPDEIIVVDDGSTDGSADILSQLTDITVIEQPNGGQAAAFNTGFAASQGDIVIFVDADDKLYPQSIEVIVRMWSPEISILSFGLHMVDGQGAPIGQYPMDLPDIDLLPRLLAQLAIPFMPTSGNAFQRSAIEWAFPLPPERWRISADALLIRAALLKAPIRHISQVLGAYRVHGQNNYFRSGDLGAWKANRGLRDLARVGLDLIELTDQTGHTLSRSERTKLLFAAARCQLKAEHLKFDSAALAGFRRKLLGLTCGWRQKISLALHLLGAQHSATLRHWAADPREAPRGLSVLPTLIRGKKICTDLGEHCSARAPFDSSMSAKSSVPSDLQNLFLGPEWMRNHAAGGMDLCRSSGQFQLRRVWSGPALLSVELAPAPSSAVSLDAFHNGLPIGSHNIQSRGTVAFTLPETASDQPVPDQIEVQVKDIAPGKFKALSRMWRKSNRLHVRAISLTPDIPSPAAGVAGTALPTPMTGLGDVVQSPKGEVLEGERLIGSGEHLSLAIPPLKSGYCLLIRFSSQQVPGHLNVLLNGVRVCVADLVPSGTCVVLIPGQLTVFDAVASLQFGFQPSSFLDDSVVSIQSLSWLPDGAVGRYGLPMITPGGWVGPGTGKPLIEFLGDGWSHQDDGSAVMHSTTAQLILSQAAVFGDAVLRLDLEPLDPLAGGAPLVLIANVNGEQRAAVRLAGPATIDVDMSGILSGPKHKVTVDLYSASRPEDKEDADDHGGIRLNGMGLAPQETPTVAANSAAPNRLDTKLARDMLELRATLKDGEASTDLASLQETLKKDIEALSTKAAQVALTADDLEQLATLGSRLPLHLDQHADILNDSDGLKGLALAMLSGTAFETLKGLTLNDLPELPTDLSTAIGRFIVAEPPAGTPKSSLADHQTYLVARLEEARILLSTAPEHAPRAELANAMITSLRARRLLFSDLPLRPHTQAFGRALEAMLLREGHDLFAPQSHPMPSGHGKLRVGVILHHTEPAPETWIWRALLRKLPRDYMEITLFLTEQNDPPKSGYEDCKTIGLAGQSLSATVDMIRAAQMDVMLLGASFVGHCFMAELCAHRLAPRQIAFSAVSPATTGLSSVDSFVLGTSVAPKSVASDYSETVIWAPQAGQAFDIPQPASLSKEMHAVTRHRLGIEDDTIILVSGAMQDKIGDDVLGVWTDVLAEVSDTVLVLYPFAASWQQNYDMPRFRARIAKACLAKGVDPLRVKVLPPLPNVEVQQILSVADIYLDSFPYSGATTTVEALQAGLPVVALKGNTQRGHQAAGWLKEFGLQELIAKTPRDYVRTAANLASHADARVDLQNRINEARDGAMAQSDFCNWLTTHLQPDYDPNVGARYLFHHMPKTAGTTLKEIFGDWFDLVQDYGEPWSFVLPPKLDLNELGPNSMLSGHFGADTAKLRQRYPETMDTRKWRKISFVRDPLQRAISVHSFEKMLRREYDQDYVPVPLGEYLRSCGGRFLVHFECDKTNWQEALDSYWFIGTVERLEDSVAYLAKQLGKTPPEFLPHENRAPRDEEISEEDIAIFRANNAIEFEIYDAIAERLDVLLSQHSRD